MEAGEDSGRCWRIKKLLPQRSGRGVGPSWRPLYLSWRRDRCRERLKKQNQWNCIISSGGYRLLTQIRWLKITAIYSPMVLEARSQKAGSWQPPNPESSGGICPCLTHLLGLRQHLSDLCLCGQMLFSLYCTQWHCRHLGQRPVFYHLSSWKLNAQ